MPKVCEFFGISIYLYFADHQPPHFHAFYGEHEAVIEFTPIRLRRGWLPPRAYGLVVEWALAHQADLRRAWEQASRPEPVDPIEPLR